MCMVNYVFVHGTLPTNKNNRILSSFFDVPIICHALPVPIKYRTGYPWRGKVFSVRQLSRPIQIPGPFDPKYRPREGIQYLARRKTILIESNVKCRLQKLTSKRTLRQVFICLRFPHLLGFCPGWSSNFVDSYSGQIESVKLLQNMVSNRTQHPHPCQPHTVCIRYTVLWHREGWMGRGGEPERRLGGQWFTKLGRKYQHDWLHLQSKKSNKHPCRKVPLQINFFRWRHFV